MFGTEEALALLKRRILRDRGLDCDQLKESFLKRRIAVRLRATGSQGYEDYLRLLRQDPREYNHLLDELTINLTQFFRDPDVYQRIRESVVSEVVKNKRESASRTIRILSAGCASGEEAYSIAILFSHCLRRESEKWKLSVLGTDVHGRSLETARKGVYEKPALLEGLRLEEYFEEWEEKGWYRVKEETHKLVKFQRKGVLDLERKNFFDLVMCRNVLIYFVREGQRDMLRALAGEMRNGGYLVLGKAEHLGPARGEELTLVFQRERIYQKRAQA